MAQQDDSIFGGLFSEPAENIQPETVGAIDYLTDIPVGAIKGECKLNSRDIRDDTKVEVSLRRALC